MKPPEPSPSQVSDQPLAGDGGIKTSPTTERDPYEALDDLMVVVEALCPRWPPRGTFRADGLWLL